VNYNQFDGLILLPMLALLTASRPQAPSRSRKLRSFLDN